MHVGLSKFVTFFQDSSQLLSYNYATKAEVGAGEHGYTLSMMANKLLVSLVIPENPQVQTVFPRYFITFWRET